MNDSVIKHITIIPGDGIGKEVAEQAVLVIRKIESLFGHQFDIQEAYAGGAALDLFGVPLPEETIDLCKKSDAILLGAVGGPKWDQLPPELKPEKGILGLRKNLGLFANLRPARIYPSLIDDSPLKGRFLTE